MRRTVPLVLCLFLAVTAGTSAWSQSEADAVKAVREFAKALVAGDLEKVASLLTQDSVFFMESATSIAPPPSMKEKPQPMFFDQQLSEAEAQALRGVCDAILLSGAQKIEPGEPVRSGDAIKVPVTIEIKRDLIMTKEGDTYRVDLAAPYPAARETIKQMTEGTEGGEEVAPEGPPGEVPGAEAPSPAPGETPGGAGETPSAPGETPSAPGAEVAPAPSGAPAGATVLPPGGGATADAALEAQRRATCMSNLKQLVLACIMCAQDYDEHLPNAATWMDMVTPYIKDTGLFHCPSDKNKYSYAMNSALSGMSIGDLDAPATTVLLFESKSGQKNAADPLTSLCDPPRHGNGNNYAFADGHAAFIAKE